MCEGEKEGNVRGKECYRGKIKIKRKPSGMWVGGGRGEGMEVPGRGSVKEEGDMAGRRDGEEGR